MRYCSQIRTRQTPDAQLQCSENHLNTIQSCWYFPDLLITCTLSTANDSVNLNANSNGATIGSFNGGTNQLTTVANLSVSGQIRNYVA